MGPLLVAFLFTAGSAAWLYNKFMKYTGGVTQRAVTATGVSAAFIFIISYIIFRAILK